MAAISTASCLKMLELYTAPEDAMISDEEQQTNVDGPLQNKIQQIAQIAQQKDDIPDPGDGTSGGGGEDGGQEGQYNPEDLGAGGSGAGKGSPGDRPEVVSESSMKIKLMSRMIDDPSLLEIFKIVGQMSEIETEIRNENLFNAPGSSELDMGSDLSRLTLQETLKPTEMLARDLAQDSAWMNVTKDGGAKGMGPLAICIDLSGSMNCRVRGDTEAKRSDVAIALALSLNKICKDQKRHMLIVGFDSSVKFTYDCEDGLITPRDMESLLHSGSWGGTAFQPPLEECRKWIDNHDYHGKADIIFLTDGEAGDTFTNNWEPLKPKDWDVKQDGKYTWAEYYESHEDHECDHDRSCVICYGHPPEDGYKGEITFNKPTIDWWGKYHRFLHEGDIRFWILHLEKGYIDRPICLLADKTFRGLENVAEMEGATRSLFTEMIENRKPNWL